MLSERIILRNLLHSLNLKFTDIGALLLSTQVRVLQNMLCSFILDKGNMRASSQTTGPLSSSSPKDLKNANIDTITTAPILERMERLAQAVTILQLERPSDWAMYSHGRWDGERKDFSGKGLNKEEVKLVMKLRVDFSQDAIEKACADL